MIKKRLLLTIVIMLCITTYVSAKSFPNYIYNSWMEPVEIPAPYRFVKMISGQTLGLQKFSKPTDIFLSDKKELYILDSGSNKVIVLDKDFNLSREINGFTKDGAAVNLKDATGIFVDKEDDIFIADKGSNYAFRCNQLGEILSEYKRPVTELFPSDIKFSPSKILKDSMSNVYVLSEGLHYGAVIYDDNSEFSGFYGSNNVKITPELLVNYFWKKIMTDDQKAQLPRYIPISYTNMCIDEKNFVYTCTESGVRKLNPGGEDVLRSKPGTFYGDATIIWEKGKAVKTVFADIDVETNGIITVLDSTRGRVFQYDSESNLLFAFGGIGTQQGTYKKPAAIAVKDGLIMVLDSGKCTISVFEPTDFGNNVRNAVILHNSGRFNEAMGPWEQVIKADTNFEIAYTGIGKALYNLGDFKKSMEYFKLSNDRYNYSLSKKEYRKNLMRDNFGVLATSVLLIFIAIVLIKVINRFRKRFNYRGDDRHDA